MVIDRDFGKMYTVTAERQGRNLDWQHNAWESPKTKQTWVWAMIRGMTKGTNKNSGKTGIKFKIPKVVFFILMSLYIFLVINTKW